MSPGLIILIVAAVLLIAGAIWMLTLGRRPQIPKGYTHVARRGGYEVTVVFQDRNALNNYTIDAVAHYCALAVSTTAKAFQAQVPGADIDVLKRCCVLFATDQAFVNGPHPSLRNAAAYLISASASVGRGIPMVVARDTLVSEVALTGEPIIHECLHALLGDYTEPDKDRDHSHPLAWKATAGMHSIQSHAETTYLGAIHTIAICVL